MSKAYYGTEKGKSTVKKNAKKQNDEGYFRFGKGAIAVLKQGATRRGIVFGLTAESLESWWRSTPDHYVYCGISIADYLNLRDAFLTYEGSDWEIKKFSRFYLSPKHKAIRWMTIDRVENEQGYEINNMVKCCWICNSIKSNFFTAEHMRLLAPALIDRLLSQLGFEHVRLTPNKA